MARDAIFWQLGGYRLRVDSGVRMLCMSRPLLENCVRQRLQALPQVVIRSETAVARLIGRPRERVCGVELAHGDQLRADLVVDASGRGSRSDRWLSKLGFPAPPESTVTMRVHYTSRLVRSRSDTPQEPIIIITTPRPPDERRLGVVVPVEGNRWLVMLGGFHGEQAPTDPAGYERFAKSLPNTAIADLLRDAEPVTDPVAYTYPASRRRHFERLREIPAGYAAIGDAVCSFNPVYAQGMTVAAREAITLGECLDRHGSSGAPMIRDFYRRTRNLITSAWNMATTVDFAHTGTEGRKPRGFALAQMYQRRLILATHVSPEAVNALVRVEHLITPGSVLLRPTMIAKVLRAARHAQKGQTTACGASPHPDSDACGNRTWSMTSVTATCVRPTRRAVAHKTVDAAVMIASTRHGSQVHGCPFSRRSSGTAGRCTRHTPVPAPPHNCASASRHTAA